MMPRHAVRRAALWVAAPVCLVGAAPWACWPSRTIVASSVLIVTLDTTRADRLPAYGAGNVSTPALDRLAREGVVFDRAESVAPLTLTAHTSLFTGLYPPRHGVRDNSDNPLDPSIPTVVERMNAQGFRTAAFVGAMVLAAGRGLARGFDEYDDGARAGAPPLRRRPANEVVDAATRWLQRGDGAPFFLWVHLFDAHAPQRLPDAYGRRYGDSYSGAIDFMDSQIGRLLDVLEQRGLLSTTAVIVVGDHGEALGDHGETEHGIFLYESVLHVPFIVRAPGVAAGRVPNLVSLVDVAPTVLDLVGLAPGDGDGVNLASALRHGTRLAERTVYAESMYARRFGWSPLRMVRDERFKFIDAPRHELYDLHADPLEAQDLSGERRALAAMMQAELNTIAAGARAQPPGIARQVSPNVEALRLLGYVSGAAMALNEVAGRDPKDYIHVYNASRRRESR